MKSERWQQVEDLYHAASEKAAGERSAFLKAACAGDEELRGEVLSLLSRESFDALVDRPIAAVAAGLMNADERFGARRSVFGTESNGGSRRAGTSRVSRGCGGFAVDAGRPDR